MSNQTIRQLLDSRLQTWARAQQPALAGAWENVPFSPTPGSTYLRPFLLPARTAAADLSGALSTWRGVYQVDVVTPINAGPGAADAIADQLAALFPAFLRLTGGDVVLQIMSPASAAKGVQDANGYTVPVSFQYRADSIT
jgi:hypothetical protein